MHAVDRFPWKIASVWDCCSCSWLWPRPPVFIAYIIVADLPFFSNKSSAVVSRKNEPLSFGGLDFGHVSVACLHLCYSSNKITKDLNSNYILTFSQKLAIRNYFTQIYSRSKEKWYKAQKVRKYAVNLQLQVYKILSNDVQMLILCLSYLITWRPVLHQQLMQTAFVIAQQLGCCNLG